MSTNISDRHENIEKRIHENNSKKNNKNIIAMSLVSFFMNFASGIIVSSCNNFLIGQLGCSAKFLGVVRGGSEALGNLVKVIFGMISDRMRNRKIFLIIGYGCMLILKPMFGISALNLFPTIIKLFIYGITHVFDRFLNGMRDGLRDLLILESSFSHKKGTSLGIRKLMACMGSTVGGIAAFFILRHFDITWSFTKYKISIFAAMYFFTIIPVSISMFILIFFVKDFFNEKYKNKPFLAEDVATPSENILPGNLWKNTLISFFGGFFIVILIRKIFKSALISDSLLSNILINTNLHNNVLKLFSILIIGLLVVELLLIKINPEFFHKNKNGRKQFVIVNDFLFSILGLFLGLCFFQALQSLNLKNALIKALFNYGLNATIIAPLILFFRLVFYSLYTKMQPVIESYSQELKKYDKIITITFILSFGKYSDIFIYKHIIEACQLNVLYTPLLYSLLYVIFGVCAYILGKLSDTFLRKNTMLVLIIINIILNICAVILPILPANMRLLFSLFTLMAYGAYVGFLDCTLVFTVARTIPIDRLLATLLGLFSLLIGVGNACASYLIGTIFKSTSQAYGFAVVPAIIGLIYFMYNKKVLYSDDISK